MSNYAEDWIRLSDLMKYPIREDHYDKENGSLEFVLGVENVLAYAQALPRVNLSDLWHDAATDPPTKAGYYLVLCEGHPVPEVLYFRKKKWACESSHFRKPILWAECPPLPKGAAPWSE